MTAVFIAVCSCLLFIYTGYNGHTIYDLQKMKDDVNVDISHKKTTNESYYKQALQILSDRNFVAFIVTNFCHQ
jgi:cell division protein FtsL